MRRSEPKTVVMIGAGGHASVLADILGRQGIAVDCLIAPDQPKNRLALAAIPRMESNESWVEFDVSSTLLINGIGQVPYSQTRRDLANYFADKGFSFFTVIDDRAIVSECCEIDEGCQILPLVVINAGSSIGAHTILNTGAIVEHDCTLEAFCHIGPGAVLCGGVSVGKGGLVGAGATVLPGVKVGDGAIVGAGCTIKGDVAAYSVCHSPKTITKTKRQSENK